MYYFYIPDNLLDDLQVSMDRARSTSRDQQYLSPSNSSTVVHERSVSPGGGVSLTYCLNKLRLVKIVFRINQTELLINYDNNHWMKCDFRDCGFLVCIVIRPYYKLINLDQLSHCFEITKFLLIRSFILPFSKHFFIKKQSS